MIKDTNKGFVQTIFLFVIILVVLSLLGLNAEKVWTNLFYPLFAFIGNIILSVAKFLTSIINYIWAILVQVGS